MATDPKKNDELKEKDLESVAGGVDGVAKPQDTGDEAASQPIPDYGAPTPKRERV